MRTPRLGVLATHPIQYHAPLYRRLAERVDLSVYFAHRQSAQGQAAAGFGVAFEWDVDLLGGYTHAFLTNRSKIPGTASFRGCHTPEIGAIIARKQFDAFLVHGWYTRSFWQAMVACWRTGTPLLVRGDSHLATPRSRLKEAVKEVVYRQFIPRFDGYLVVGELAKEYYLHYGADPARMYFVPHFVDNDFFRSKATTPDGERPLRTELGFGDDALVLLFVGKFVDKKRPIDVVYGAAALRQRGHDARILFVGSGALEEAVRAEARRVGVPAHFAGFKNQTELPAHYAASDLLVLPSESETWGLVVNEAMACGTPAVVSDAVGCAPDLIAEGRTGAVYPVGNAGALADAVERMVPHLGSEFVRRELVTTTNTYSVERAVRGVLSALEHVRRPLGPKLAAVPSL